MAQATTKKRVTKKRTVKKPSTAMAATGQQQVANVQQGGSLSPIEQMQQLKAMGVSLDDMQSMLNLQKQYEAAEALKAFNKALADFKSEEISIYKTKTVSYTSDKGSTTEYNHATLSDIVDIAVPFLSKHGFSHRWRTEQKEGGMTRVTFVLTHQAGHSEETGLQAGLDQSGGKNNIQALASTVSYLERYTFLAGTGLAVKEMDDDGRSAEPVETIDEFQLANIESLISEVGANELAFMKFFSITALEDLPRVKYNNAISALEAKR